MKIIRNQAGEVYTSTPADDYIFEFMMGYIGQGHGHVRVRGFIPFVRYLRIQYGWDLAEAAGVAKAWEAAKDQELHEVWVATGRSCPRPAVT